MLSFVGSGTTRSSLKPSPILMSRAPFNDGKTRSISGIASVSISGLSLPLTLCFSFNVPEGSSVPSQTTVRRSLSSVLTVAKAWPCRSNSRSNFWMVRRNGTLPLASASCVTVTISYASPRFWPFILAAQKAKPSL